MEHLLSQSGKGVLEFPVKEDHLGIVLPEKKGVLGEEEDMVEGSEGITMCLAVGDLSAPAEAPKVHMSKCERCDIELPTGDMVVHLVTHFQDEVFSCDICGESFSSAAWQNDHIKLHSVTLLDQSPTGTGKNVRCKKIGNVQN